MWNENLEDIVVVKRSGQRVNFNASKIAIAIKKGFEAVYDNPKSEEIFKVFESVLTFLNENYKDRKTINVEDIQDIIENTLKKQGQQDVYNAYHNYREKRLASRQVFSEKQQHKFVRAMEKLNDGEGKQLNDTTPKDTLIKFGSIISSEYVKSYTLDSKISRAIDEGSIYIHNLDNFYLGYISKVNIKVTPNKDDEDLCLFAKNIESALDEVSEELAITNLDKVLEDYFLEKYRGLFINHLEKYLSFTGFIDYISLKKYEDITNRCSNLEEVNTLVKELSTNETTAKITEVSIKDTVSDLNTCIKAFVKKLWKIKNKKAKLTISLSDKDSAICKMIRNEIIRVIDANDYNNYIHVTLNPNINDEYIDKISSLILDNKNISVSFSSDTYFQDGTHIADGISGETTDIGRMIASSTSINMARLALKCSNKKIDDFYEKLDNALELAKNALLLEFETLGNKYRENYEVLFSGNILGDERLEQNQKIRKIIKTGTLNIGLVGLYECVYLLDNNDTTRIKTLLKILEHIENKCKLYKEETKLNFVLFEPSDEKSSKRLIDFDKSIYNIIKGVTDKDAYSHVCDYLDLADLVKLHKYLQGGFLVRVKIHKNATIKTVSDTIKTLGKSGIKHISIERGTS